MSNNRWIFLAVIVLARTALAFQFQSVIGVSASLTADLGIGLAELGVLVGAYMLPGIIVAIPGGALGTRFGVKRVAVVGLALMAAGGAITALSGDIVLATTGRVIAGIGGVTVNVLLAGMVADWFSEDRLVTAMAILVASWPAGIGIALVIGPFIGGGDDGWRAMMWLTAYGSLATGVLLAAVYRSPGKPPVQSEITPRATLTREDFWLATWSGQVWGLFNVGYILMVSFMPALMLADGVSPVTAGFVTSLATWILILSIPLGGLFIERSGRGTAVMVICFAVMGLAMAAPSLLPAALASVILVGLFAGPPAGAIMALPAQALRPETRATGMGIYFTWYYVGMAVLPPLAGWIGDATGAVSAPLIFGAVVMLATIVSLGIFIRLRNAKFS